LEASWEKNQNHPWAIPETVATITGYSASSVPTGRDSKGRYLHENIETRTYAISYRVKGYRHGCTFALYSIQFSGGRAPSIKTQLAKKGGFF
jgi:hypothetical protein